MSSETRAMARLQRASVWSAVAVFAVTLAATIAVNVADAAPRILVLGSSRPAQPACPGSPCEAVGKVTGFQTAIGSQRSPFRAPFEGKLVAWSIKLSTPNESQRSFFDEFYGGPPRARVAVLRSLRRKNKRKFLYRLRAQSPVEDLSSLLGQTTTFTLSRPLTVRKGDVVALTIPTWAPAFAVGQAQRTTWRASRRKGRCRSPGHIRAGSPQQVPGRNRNYFCAYSTARLLYSATIVRNPQASG